MLIEPSKAPQAAFDAIFDAVTTVERELSIGKSGQAPLTSRTLYLSVPHRIAYLALGKIRDGGSLREATVTENWSYLVLEEQRAPAAGGAAGTVTYKSIATATALAGEAGRYKLGSWHDGPLVAGTAKAIGAAEEEIAAEDDADGRSRTYEPLLLLAPAVHLTALWLKDRGSGRSDAFDWVVPIPPSNSKLTPHKPIRSHDVFAGLLESAAKVRSRRPTA